MSELLTIRQAMRHAAEMNQKSGKPLCYYWSAVWWRLHSKDSKNAPEPLQYSRNQMALYKSGCMDWQEYKARGLE